MRVNQGKMGNKVIIGFFLTALLVIGVSLITYFSIRNLLDTVESLSKPNEKLRQLNGLMADVYLLDMSKTERTSDKDSVLEETLKSVQKRLEWLKLNASDSSEIQSFENTSLNISELMVVFAGLEETRYNVVNRNFSLEALKNIERKIKRQQELSEMQFLGRIRNRDTFPIVPPAVQLEDLPSAQEESIDFSSKHGEIEEFLIQIKEDFEELKSLDFVSETLNSESALLDLRNLVAHMYKDEQKLQENFVQLESRLLAKNKEVFAQIQDLISQMQSDLLMEYKNQNQSAYDLTYKVSIVLALLVFFGLVGSLGFVHSILSEVKKADTYREKLEEAKRHSDNLAKAKQDFLANMSHEIRNPLHAIQGFQKELAKSARSGEQKEYVEMIAFASDTLVEIVDDILDFSKLEAGKIKIENEPFDPFRLFYSIKNIFAVKAEMKKLYFHWDLDFPERKWMVGDKLRINQILSNVLSNALKFTQEGGIKVNIILLNPKILQIIVKDSGMGMTAEVRDNIFQEFTQGDSSITRKFGGTGLGLSITKKLLDLLGGNIKVDSEFESGTTIFIEIPLELTNEVKAPVNQYGKEYSLRGLKILLIEDDPIGLKLVKLLLESKGAFVDEYEGGMAFKNRFKFSSDFDLAIVDIQMPEVSGLEVLKMLRSDKNHKRFPVMAITANVFAEEKNEISNLGFDCLLLKPFNEHQIISKIGELIGSSISDGEFDLNHNLTSYGPIFSYDLSSLRRFCMDDDDMLAEVLQDIVQLSHSDLSEIMLCLKSGNFKRIKDITHQLSSRLAQIHLPVVTQIRGIEVAIKEDKLNGLEKEIITMVKETEFFLEKIKVDMQAMIH